MVKGIYYFQYLLVAGFWWLYKILPIRWTYAIGWGLGVGAFALFRKTKRARISVDNVIIAGLASTRREAYLIARNSLGHFIGHLCEAIRISQTVTHDNWQKYVELELTPKARELIFNPTEPILLATGHLGAWEAGITAITSVRPMLAVARLMDNPYIQKFLESHNFRGGATIIPKKQGFKGSAIHRWRESNAALTILFDQYSSRGVRVPFFGNTVPVYTSPARLHLKTKAPIVVGGFLRTGLLRYKMVTVGDPIYYTEPADNAEAVKTLTAEFISRLEEVIRMAPDQYLWIHRRFRGIPVPEVPEK